MYAIALIYTVQNRISVPSCQSELQTYLGNQQNGVPLLGARKPVCDTNGMYSPKQCSGSQWVF